MAVGSHDAGQPAKQVMREQIWRLLEDSGASPPGRAVGRIPDFYGSEQAAGHLAELSAWKQAQVVKANPDRAQLPVRVNALAQGKLVYMAVPKLAKSQPFYLLDPARRGEADEPIARVVSSSKVAEHAVTVGLDGMKPVDLVVCGSTVVNRQGVRIGKGAGYSDIEVALLAEAGLIRESTVIVTTVHDLQVVDEDLPSSTHDFTVDYIATPSGVIGCGSPYRPAGLVWANLKEEQIRAIPVLKRLARARRRADG